MALVPIERQVNVATVAARLRQQMGLKDAATKEASEFATAAEGVLATTALQPGEAATPEQGALADTAVQPGDLGDSATLDVGTTAGTVAAGDDDRITGAQFRIPTFAAAAAATIPTGVTRVEITDRLFDFEEVSSEPAHDLKFQNDGNWYSVERGIPHEYAAGAASDNTTDDTAAILRLVAWAMIDPKRRKVSLIGRVYCALDVPDIHKVQWEGPGSIRIGTGPEFFPCPSNLNRGFGSLGYNDLFVSPTGSATASGLSDQFPMSIPRLREVLAQYSPLQGLWRLRLGEGVYRDALSLWDSESGPLSFYIAGPAVDTWDNTNPPPGAKTVSAIGLTNPATLTIASHGLTSGDKIFLGRAAKAGGYHEADGAIYTVTVVDANTVSIGVDGTGWSAYTGGGKAYPLKGSRPKAVGYGSGAGSGYWITGQNNDNIQINDVLCINWGVKDGSSANQDGGIVATGHSNIRAINTHALDNQWGVIFRDSSIGQWQSGEGSDNQKACWAIDARVTFGIPNPSATRTDTLLLQRNTWACDMWEMANGHCDGNRLVDNITDVEVRKNAHLVFIKNEITNTGAAKNSIIANYGQFNGDETANTWIGSFNNFIQRGQGARVDRGPMPWDWISVDRRQVQAIAAAAGEVTIMSLDIPQTQMYILGQGIRARFYNALSAMAGTLTLRFKVGGTTLFTRVIPLSANTRGLDFEYEMHSNSFGGARARYKELLTDDVAVTTAPYMKAVAGGSLDTRAAGTTFTVTAQFSNAADTMGAFGFQQIDTMGW